MPKAKEAPQIDQLFTEVKDLSDQLLQLPGQKYQRELIAEELATALKSIKKQIEKLQILAQNKGVLPSSPLLFKDDFKEYNFPLSYLSLPLILRRKLSEKMDISSIGELVVLSPYKIVSTKGFTEKDLFVISMALQQLGLQLNTKIL
ncbi:MAG: hypothetical protein ACRCZE_00620 [Candidatus Altimarinota bacterium]